MTAKISGFFELPGRSGRHAGFLEAGRDIGANLTILIQEEIPFYEIRAQFQNCWIHGELDNGKHVTLPVAYLIQNTYGHTAHGVKTLNFSCPQAIIGEFSFDKFPIEFDAVRLDFKWLRSWLGKRVIKTNLIRGSTHFTLSNLPSEVFTIKIDSSEFELIIKQEGWFSQRKQGITEIQQKTYLLLVPRERKEIKWFLDQENSLWKLISLITGQESEVRQFKGVYITNHRYHRKSRNFKYNLSLSLRSKLRINSIENSVNMNSEAELYRKYTNFSGEEGWNNNLLTYQENSPQFKDIVQKWYLLPATLRHVASLLMAATREDDYYLESRLANLVQAAEATHRSLFPDSTSALPKTEYRQLSKKFTAWVATETDLETAKILSNRFGNLNMISFHSRLIQLFSPLWDDFIHPHSVEDNLESLLKEIGKLRNDLSHGNNSDAGEIQRQRYMVDLLTQMLRIILLEKLGWTLKDAIDIVSKHGTSQSVRFWVESNRAPVSDDSSKRDPK